MIGSPWGFKIVYGMISDNMPICGSRRRSYLIICSIMQFIVMFALTFTSGMHYLVLTSGLLLGALSVAMMDVIVDSLMVV
jgi:MFS family permease